jgi:hypothetical protein
MEVQEGMSLEEVRTRTDVDLAVVIDLTKMEN